MLICYLHGNRFVHVLVIYTVKSEMYCNMRNGAKVTQMLCQRKPYILLLHIVHSLSALYFGKESLRILNFKYVLCLFIVLLYIIVTMYDCHRITHI